MALFVFRADANTNIGMGHIMRCLSIADAAKANKQDIIFILADENVLDLIKKRGYRFLVLDSDYSNMDLEIDKWPDELSPNRIFVDSYYVTNEYFDSIKTKYPNSKLVYMDDVGTIAYPVDYLVNYNAFGPEINYKKLYSEASMRLPKLILGSIYAPLRTMFQEIPKRTQKNHVKNVLISTGGADEYHVALGLIAHIGESLPKDYDINYHFLIGAMNKDKHQIYDLSMNISSVILHENVNNMRELIESCDIVVSAAGSTMYEICACGVPMINYSLADNQKPGAKAFGELGLAMNIGDLRIPESIDTSRVFSGELKEDAIDIILDAVKKMARDYNLRCSIGSRMQELIDGRGAERIICRILDDINI